MCWESFGKKNEYGGIFLGYEGSQQMLDTLSELAIQSKIRIEYRGNNPVEAKKSIADKLQTKEIVKSLNNLC